MEHEVPCGGWCPEGRKAEDGVIPESYPVTELIGGGYRDRTRKNVQDSDGTVILYFKQLAGGTELTRIFCSAEQKPCLLLDGDVLEENHAAEQVFEFFSGLPGGTLNIAGPRAGGDVRAYPFTVKVIGKFIALCRRNFLESGA